MSVQRFRSKPVEIEAIRFTGNNTADIWEWQKPHVHGLATLDRGLTNGGPALWFFTKAQASPPYVPEGKDAAVYDYLHSTWVGVATGDWIIKGTKGEFYPCEDEVFRQKYEPTEEQQ